MNHTGQAPFDMFFYGTLKRGQRNHSFCRNALRVSEAAVQGSLYDLPEGYPALVVLEQDILAVGTSNYSRDARTGKDYLLGEIPTVQGSIVFGELYTFGDPEERLPSIDRLEEFSPGETLSPYRRVLIAARTEDGTSLAWAYVVANARGTRLPGGRWPA